MKVYEHVISVTFYSIMGWSLTEVFVKGGGGAGKYTGEGDIWGWGHMFYILKKPNLFLYLSIIFCIIYVNYHYCTFTIN